MNQRIRLLAEQAKQSALAEMIKIHDKDQALKVYSETYDTKFARLIVEDCMQLCTIHVKDPELLMPFDAGIVEGYRRGKENMKEYFGVEE